jgi:MFS family permease
MSIFPYIYFMIKDFNITEDSRQIAVYAGMVTSVFAFAEFSASVFWGRLSDRIGRKPILLTGLAGTGISMLAFGFATNFPTALLARALGGLLNGYVSHSPTFLQGGLATDVFKEHWRLDDYRGRSGHS